MNKQESLVYWKWWEYREKNNMLVDLTQKDPRYAILMVSITQINILSNKGHNSYTPLADGMRKPSSPIPNKIPQPQEENE